MRCLHWQERKNAILLDRRRACRPSLSSKTRGLQQSGCASQTAHRVEYDNRASSTFQKNRFILIVFRRFVLQTKPLTASEEIVPVPHVFKHNEKRSILALAADEENQAKALEAGAELSLGADMIKKILKGQFRVDDYDFCVAHTNMSTLIAPLRGVLRSRFPTQLNGAF